MRTAQRCRPKLSAARRPPRNLSLLWLVLNLGCSSQASGASTGQTVFPAIATASASTVSTIKLKTRASDPLDVVTGASRFQSERARALDRKTADALSAKCPSSPPAELSFYLTKPAWVRVRVVDRRDDHIVYRTLWSWRYRPKGRQRLHWDGRRDSGDCFDKSHAFIQIQLAETKRDLGASILHER